MIIFYLKQHWGGVKAVLGFGTDWVRTLVSMATDSSHRVIIGKMVSPLFMPPTLKKWGAYWFRLVRMYVSMYRASRYLETSCMDSSWKNSRHVFFFRIISPCKITALLKTRDEIL